MHPSALPAGKGDGGAYPIGRFFLPTGAGQWAAAVMTLLRFARLNGLDPYTYIMDVLTRLPTWPAGWIEEWLPHRWQPDPRTDPPRDRGV